MEKGKLEKYTELLKNDSVIKHLKCIGFKGLLTGGAVIDIIMGRAPKDYDIVDYSHNSKNILLDNGYTLFSDSVTATTFNGYFDNKEIIVQLLKTKIQDFDFEISKSTFDIKDNRLSLSYTFYDKVLIPINWENPKTLLNCLHRVPHYEKKGFHLPEITYHSMLGVISRGIGAGSMFLKNS